MEGRWLRRTNQELDYLYNEATIIGVVKSQRIRWLGHLVRMGEERIPNRILKMNMGGMRKRRGRPKSKWKCEVQEDLNCLHTKKWMEVARDRKKWSSVVKQAMGLQGP